MQKKLGTRRSIRAGIVSGAIAGITLLHYVTAMSHVWLHPFLENSYYVPVGGTLCAGIVNRYTFEKLRNFGYAKLLRLFDSGDSARDWLGVHYGMTFWKRLTFPIAHRTDRTSRKEAACVMEGCDCTWCRCQHESTAKPASQRVAATS